LMRFAVAAHHHLVRILLMPFERSLGPVHFNPDVILPAMRDLRGCHGAKGAIAKAEDRRAVIVKDATTLECLEHAGNLLRNQAGDKAAEIVSVSADIAEAAGGA